MPLYVIGLGRTPLNLIDTPTPPVVSGDRWVLPVSVFGGTPPELYTPLAALPEAPETLAAAKAQALRLLRQKAHLLRAQVLTNGVGEDVTYLEKRNEALAAKAIFDAGGTPVPSDYPYLRAESQELGVGMKNLAIAVLAADATAKTTLVQIEAQRRKASVAVQAATLVSQIDAIVQGVAWPTIP